MSTEIHEKTHEVLVPGGSSRGKVLKWDNGGQNWGSILQSSVTYNRAICYS